MRQAAAGLAQEARLLIMDEPATFLDPGHQELLLDMVRRLNRERGCLSGHRLWSGALRRCAARRFSSGC